jgi:hypothetical protein
MATWHAGKDLTQLVLDFRDASYIITPVKSLTETRFKLIFIYRVESSW